VQFNLAQRELTLKVVYYGPALSGKTTNLQQIHRIVDEECRGHLMVLNTRDDRTLFFDLMPLVVQSQSGRKVRLKLFTVPGQVIHDSTRRVVLQGADAVIFVADSRLSEARNNTISFKNLRENLKANGIEDVPVVIQFNKRDLSDVRTDADIDVLATKSKEPIYKAVALRGQGVAETLCGLLQLLWGSLDRQYDIRRKHGLGREEFLAPFFKALGLELPTLPPTPGTQTEPALRIPPGLGGGEPGGSGGQ
jgi:mutual gliding-motility protein MglA